MGAIGPLEREAVERATRVRAMSRVCGRAASGLALLTLFAWTADSRWPIDVRHASAALKPQTCVSILLLAAAIEVAARRPTPGCPLRERNLLRVAFALSGGAIPFLALIEYAAGASLGIDLLLLSDTLLAVGVEPVGRMSLLTALFLTVVALGLVLPAPRSLASERVSNAIAAMTVTACFLILCFQLQGRSAEGAGVTLQPVSVSAALALFLIGLGSLLARPERGWLQPLLGDDVGGHLLRRMLPAAGLLPFALGFAVVWGATSGLFGPRTAIGLLVAAVAVPLAGLVLWSARSMNQLAAERARSEARLRSLVEASPIGIAYGRLDGTITDANDAYLRIVGRERRELEEGRLDWRRFTTREHASRDAAAVAELTRSGSARPYEKEIELPDGTRVPVLVGGMRLSTSDEVACVMLDITRQRAGQARLRQSEARYRRIVETAQEGILIVDADGRIRFGNASLARMLGCSVDALVNQPFVPLLVYEEDRDGWAPLLRPGAPAVQPAGDLRLRCPDGDELWGVVSVSPIEAGLGLPEGRLVMLTDVTARRRTERALQQAARIEATSTLAAGVAHDVNNLMAAVLGNADLLRDELPKRGDAGEMVESIRDAASRAAELAQQLLAYARGGRNWSRPVDLNQVAKRTLDIHRRSWPRSMNVKLDLDPTLPSVIADASQMSQIVMNLCANAVDATDGRGRLTLSTRSLQVAEDAAEGGPGAVSLVPGRWVRLSVEDDGCGMDALTAARVFEPFFSTKFPGRGLGLAAVYGIVQNHGGQIALDTVSGRGTRVDVWLPAAREPMPEDTAPTEGDAPRGAETVLVVDDEETVLTVTTRLLERLGYRVVRARNGREAVSYARTAGVAMDAVILDLDMPVMDGASAFPLLRAERPGVPIVVCSGYELDPGSPRLRGIVPDAYLAKPFRRDALARVLREAIDRSTSAS